MARPKTRDERIYRFGVNEWDKPCRTPSCYARVICVQRGGSLRYCPSCREKVDGQQAELARVRKAERRAQTLEINAAARAERGTVTQTKYEWNRRSYLGVRSTPIELDEHAHEKSFADPNPKPEAEVRRRAEVIRMLLGDVGWSRRDAYQVRTRSANG